MSDEAQRWKEKYLKSIDQQDKLERRWNARLDLLRRGLVRSSLAAEGVDKAVDQCMKEMREIVRKDDMDAGLAALIPRLEKAVLDSEQRREKRAEQMGTALTSLVTQLQALPLPKEVSKPLKLLAKGLEERVDQARELPLLLGELSGLQGQALALLEHPELAARPGFLQRLFGGWEASGQVPAAETVEQSSFVNSSAHQPPVQQDDDDSAPADTAELQKTQWVNEAPVQSELQDPLSAAATEQPAVLAVEPLLPAPSAESQPSETLPEQAPVSVETVIPDDTTQEKDAPVDAPELAVAVADVPALEAPPTTDAEKAQALPQAQQAELETQAAADDALQPADSNAEPGSVEGASVEAEKEDDLPIVGDDDPYALPSSPEPSYSSVAAHIEETLLGLLDDLTLPEHHRPQAEAMRARLEHGLNWYELLPILDDLAVFMLAITNSGQHEFETYLTQLNERLESFQSNLLAASADHADTQSAASQLNDQLRKHVGGLQSSVQEASDLDSLKILLENRLEGLLGTLDQHQKARDEREQEVVTKLQSLVGRVSTMEQEAQGFCAHLDEQRQKALIDTLTGLPNRAAWNERLDQEIEQLQKNRSSLLMGILDLDHFKRINDEYGHLAGDKVLKIIASQLKKRLRSSDFIARFGGEEFVFLLPHTAMPDGLVLLERLRSTIEQCPFHFKGEPVTITVSMGVTIFKADERSDLVLKRADEALYRAKGEGRNRIEQG